MRVAFKDNKLFVMISAFFAAIFLLACFSVTNASAAPRIESLSTGTATACAVVDSRIKCWGSNTYGILGNGSADSSSATPVDVHSSTPTANWTEVIPESTSCFVFIFEICNTTPEQRIQRTSPSALYGLDIEKVSVGSEHACAVASARVYCWGRNNHGQLGNRTANNSGIPVAVSTSTGSALRGKEVNDVSVGDGFTCASATDGSVACWGNNAYGQLGTGNRTGRNYPVSVSNSNDLNGKKVAKLAILKGKAATMCAITLDGTALCWGQNYAGQAGVGGTAAASNSGSASRTITSGGSTSNGSHCMYKASESTAIKNAAISTLNDVLVPRNVLTTQKFTEITMTAGDDYGYATANTTSGSSVSQRVHFWGGFTHLGDPTHSCSRSGSHRTARVTVKRYYAGQTVPKGPLHTSDLARELKNQKIALVSGNTYVGSTWLENKLCTTITTSGSWWSTTTKTVCNESPDDITCAALASDRSKVNCESRAQSCVNNSTGTEEGDAWLRANGQWVETCGYGPVPVPSGAASWLKPGMNVTDMDTGYSDYSCAVANNTIGCWGKNGSGQLGDGSRTDKSTPVKVAGI